MKKQERESLFGSYKSWTLLDVIRECGRLRRRQYASMAAYDAAQQKAKAAAQPDVEAEILAEIAAEDHAA